jgi:hypothetical protein
VNKRYVRADGSRLHTRERVRAIRDEAGKPISLQLISFDQDAGAGGQGTAVARE